MSKGRGSSWDTLTVNTQSEKFDDSFDRFDIPTEYAAVRLLGDVYLIRVHWIPTLKKGKPISYPTLCPKNNGEDEPCPICEASIRGSTYGLTNAIIRDLQQDEPKNPGSPEKGQKFRKKGDKWWSPVRVLQFPNGAMIEIKRLSDLNKVKKKDGTIISAPINDPRYGRDLMVMLDKTKSGSGMYSIQRDEACSLDEEEREYLLYDLEKVYDNISSYDDLLKELARAYERGLLDDENCNMRVVRRLVKDVAVGGKNKQSDEENEDEDEDEKPSRSRRKRRSEEDDDLENEKPSKARRKRRDDDEDGDNEESPSSRGKRLRGSEDIDDNDLDDDLENEKPSKARRKRRDDDEEDEEKPSRKRSRQVDEDEDDPEENENPRKRSRRPEGDDIDDTDLDEDEDEKPSRSRRRRRSEEDDDLENEKPSKAQRKRRDDDEDDEEKPSRKRSRQVDEDDEDELAGLDLDEDDEEEKPKNSRGRRR